MNNPVYAPLGGNIGRGPTIKSIQTETDFGNCQVNATMEDGSKLHLFNYYIDEISISSFDLLGLTVDEAREHRHKKDVAYLQS